MPLIEWNEQFLLGVPQFDEHHEHLVNLLNTTYDDFINGASNKSSQTILDELIDYATYHFSAEEYWMEKNNYPRLVKHQGEHKYFVDRVVTLQKDFHDGREKMSLEILSFLKNWLSSHILGSDADYGDFVANRPK